MSRDPCLALALIFASSLTGTLALATGLLAASEPSARCVGPRRTERQSAGTLAARSAMRHAGRSRPNRSMAGRVAGRDPLQQTGAVDSTAARLARTEIQAVLGGGAWVGSTDRRENQFLIQRQEYRISQETLAPQK